VSKTTNPLFAKKNRKVTLHLVQREFILVQSPISVICFHHLIYNWRGQRQSTIVEENEGYLMFMNILIADHEHNVPINRSCDIDGFGNVK
jgi:hypothetical protein